LLFFYSSAYQLFWSETGAAEAPVVPTSTGAFSQAQRYSSSRSLYRQSSLWVNTAESRHSLHFQFSSEIQAAVFALQFVQWYDSLLRWFYDPRDKLSVETYKLLVETLTNY